MSNVVLLGYGLDQPSFRHRMRTLVDPLRDAGWQVRTERFPSGRYGLRTWERRELFRWADVTVLHQIKLSSIEARLFCPGTAAPSFSRSRIPSMSQSRGGSAMFRTNPLGARKNLPPPAGGP